MDRNEPRNPPASASRARRQIALMWRGNIHAPQQPTNHSERFKPLIAELIKAGIDPSPVVYFDDDVATVRERLLQVDGILVWINPLQDGQDRSRVDALLRDVAASGVWVSAHPDTILKMGTKQVLYRTQQLGWGSDTDLYESFDAFALRFPVKLSVAGTRVLKPMRGNDGQGVLRVEPETRGSGNVRVQAAFDDSVEALPLGDFLQRMGAAFANGGRLIDQAFQPNVAAGMVRCYMSGARVVGFSQQAPKNQQPTAEAPQFRMNSAKTMHGADASQFSELRRRMEQEWTPGLQRILDIGTEALPALWDADFLHRSPDAVGISEHVLCEINVSSVSPFPDAAAPRIAETVRSALEARRK